MNKEDTQTPQKIKDLRTELYLLKEFVVGKWETHDKETKEKWSETHKKIDIVSAKLDAVPLEIRMIVSKEQSLLPCEKIHKKIHYILIFALIVLTVVICHLVM